MDSEFAERQADAIARADEHRAQGAEYKALWLQEIDRARMIERTWRIPEPCHLCGSRDCNH